MTNYDFITNTEYKYLTYLCGELQKVQNCFYKCVSDRDVKLSLVLKDDFSAAYDSVIETISIIKEQINNLTTEDKLDASVKVLETIAEVIASDKVEFKGTKLFKPKMLNAVFADKTLNFSIDDSSEKEYGMSMLGSDTAYYLDLRNRDWYVFDDCFGTSEEKLLIHYIDKKYDDLKKKYFEIYLLRNEKHFRKGGKHRAIFIDGDD